MLLAGSRFVVAGVGLLVIWRLLGPQGANRGWLIPRSSLRRTAILSLLMFPVANGLVTWAEVDASSATVALLWATYPLWLALLVFVQTRRLPRGGVVLGMILGLAGLGIALAPVAGSAAVPAGAFWAVTVAVLAWGLATLFAQKEPGRVPLLLDSAWQMILGGVTMLTVSLLLGEPGRLEPSAVTNGSVLGWGYLVLFGSAGFPLYLWLLGRVSAGVVATYAYVCPAIAVGLGVLVRAEPFGPRMAAMALLVLMGVVLTVRSGAREEPATGGARNGRPRADLAAWASGLTGRLARFLPGATTTR